MVMPVIPYEKTVPGGAETEGARRPMLVAAPQNFSRISITWRPLRRQRNTTLVPYQRLLGSSRAKERIGHANIDTACHMRGGEPSGAQTENGRPPASELQDAPQLRPTAVAIIAMNALPVEVQMQVKAKIAQTSMDDMQALRRSIDATPEASSALRAEGFSSR